MSCHKQKCIFSFSTKWRKWWIWNCRSFHCISKFEFQFDISPIRAIKFFNEFFQSSTLFPWQYIKLFFFLYEKVKLKCLLNFKINSELRYPGKFENVISMILWKHLMNLFWRIGKLFQIRFIVSFGE